MEEVVLDEEKKDLFKKGKKFKITIDKAPQEDRDERKEKMPEYVDKLSSLCDNLYCFKLKYANVFEIDMDFCEFRLHIDSDKDVNWDMVHPLYKLKRWEKYRYLYINAKDVRRIRSIIFDDCQKLTTNPFSDFVKFTFKCNQTSDEKEKENK